jgi:hypothetical protein
MPRSVGTLMERVRPIISYGPSYGAPESRYSESPFREDPYMDDLRRDDFLRRRERDVEEYIIDGRLDGRAEGRRPIDFVDRRDPFYEPRPSPIVWNNRHPFAPTPLPRRYSRDDSSLGW